MAATAVLLTLVAVGSTAFGQNCPTSPNYSPDFSSNQSCLTLNGTPVNSGYPGFFGPASTLTQPQGTPNPAQPAPSGVNTVLRLTPNAAYYTGSAWFNTPLPVGSSFTTSFTFQLSGASDYPADGIAFVIQNSPAGTSAIEQGASGWDGCGLGFGDSPTGDCASTSGGISNSLAVEFDSFQNADINDVSGSHISIQSCGTGPNSVDVTCRLTIPSPSGSAPADVNLLTLKSPINIADGYVHYVTINYVTQALPSQSACIMNSLPGPCLDVTIDGNDLFPGGVPFDISTIGLSSGNAYVGFTGGTGGGNDNQDILGWTFTPQGQTQTLQPGVPATYPFQNDAYDYEATLNGGSSPTTTTVTPVYMTPQDCDALVQETYKGAHCFIYADLSPNSDSAVMFEVTCPNLPNNECNPFSAELGTSFTLSSESGVNMFNATDPFPGWLKGFGGNSVHPCAPPATGNLFQSNQIDSFTIDTKTRGGSGNTGSCWVATYDQPDETLSAITITSPTNTSYAQGSMVTASYGCPNPSSSQPNISNNLPSGPVGPYLVTASCTQSTGSQNSCTQSSTGLTCTGSVDTSTAGNHSFQVTAIDSGLNTSTKTVTYNVVAPTNLQILNVGLPGTAGTGSNITYAIGVADLGPANAVGVMVTDPLPSNTSFVSGSGSNVTCSIVNKKLSCSTTPIQCSASGNTVSCGVGMLAPLSISSLNGGTIQIKVKVTGQPATMCGKKPCTIDTATVSAANPDTNSNPTSTTQTIW
ncbi:MAG TPA: hypothetical protein VMG31_13290 [Verrucomicrobiae bacterium]|nr:hypothetical protein [Verrucomicrobiae bacterium]